MTLKQVIDFVGGIKPHAFPPSVITQWVNEIEGQVFTEVLLRGVEEYRPYIWDDTPGAEDDRDTVLLAKPPHDKLYWAYVAAMVDFANGEYNRYQNSMQMANAFFGEYVDWFSTTYRPADKPCPGLRPYYLTAYGIAVAHGFPGTEEEWLAALKGEKGDKGDTGQTGPQGPKGDDAELPVTTALLKGDGSGGAVAAVPGTDYLVSHQSLADYRTSAEQDIIDAGKYSKPSGGIPKTDLASAVQTSLGLADSALQSHQSLAAYRTAAAQDVIDAEKVSVDDYDPTAKTDSMTQPVGKDADGKLWTAPGGDTSGIFWVPFTMDEAGHWQCELTVQDVIDAVSDGQKVFAVRTDRDGSQSIYPITSWGQTIEPEAGHFIEYSYCEFHYSVVQHDDAHGIYTARVGYFGMEYRTRGGKSYTGIELDVGTLLPQSSGFLVGQRGTQLEWMPVTDKQDTAKTATVQVAVSDWRGKTCTKSVPGVTAYSIVICDPDNPDVTCTAQGDGTITLSCTSVPTATVTVKVVLL